jgi:hypothetical protein
VNRELLGGPVPDRGQIGGFLFWAAVIGGLLWYATTKETPKPTPTLTAEQSKAQFEELKKKIAARMPPGWYDLSNCATFSSYRGDKELIFTVRHRREQRCRGALELRRHERALYSELR